METARAVGALSALAQETRLEALRLLVECGSEGLPAGELAEELDVPAPTLSFHLRALAQAGLVKSAREGRSLIYTADFEALRDVVAFLTENCCRGRPRRGRA